MNTKKILLSALLSCLFVSARADDAAQPVIIGSGVAGPAMSGIVYVDQELGNKVVKNAPYSAEGDQETQRNLSDGNQITTKISMLRYRDSYGNTRQETRSSNGEMSVISFHTVADNANYNLVPMAKLAMKMSLNTISARGAAIGAAAGSAAAAAENRIETERKEGKPATAEHKDGEDIIVKRAAPNSAPNIDILPFLAGAYGDMQWAIKAITKDLGAKDFDGVKAEGKLRSYEIPAGEAGNRNPIVVTDENWYSPELQVTLYSKHSDPRTGVVVYRLSNLKRGEQAAALFSVPSDYTVIDMMEGPEKALGTPEALWKKK